MIVHFPVPDPNSKITAKYRPVLLLWDSTIAVVFPITSKYKTKNPQIRRKYFEITDWRASGLIRHSWIDTGNMIQIDLPTLAQLQQRKIGVLSSADFHKLVHFLTHH
jgi:hypothetical protein